MRFPAFLLLATLAATPAAAQSYRDRLPEDEVLYFLLPDRFENGDTANDRGGLLQTLTTSDTALTALLAPVATLLGATLPAGCEAKRSSWLYAPRNPNSMNAYDPKPST